MPEITWRNVNSLANSTGVQNAIGNLQYSLTALGNVGTKYIDKRIANEEEYRKNLKTSQHRSNYKPDATSTGFSAIGSSKGYWCI